MVEHFIIPIATTTYVIILSSKMDINLKSLYASAKCKMNRVEIYLKNMLTVLSNRCM